MSESAVAALEAAQSDTDVSRETSPPIALDSQPNEKAAPRARAPRKTAAKRPASPRRAKAVDIESGMATLYTTLGIGISMVPSAPSKMDPSVSVTNAIGQTVVAQAQKAAHAWKQLADDNPAVQQALEKLLTVSAIGGLITAHAPIILVAATAAGAIPTQIGVALGEAFADESDK